MDTETSVRILVVEDDDSLRDMLLGLLEDEGYEVAGARSGEEAITKAEEQVFQLVVADVKLGGVDGLDALSAIKSQQSELESLVITGYSTEADSIRAIRLGVGNYLKKPFTMDDFLRAVGERVARIEQQRAVRGRERAALKTTVWALESLAAPPPDGGGALGLVPASRLGAQVAEALGLAEEAVMDVRLGSLVAGLQGQPSYDGQSYILEALPTSVVSVSNELKQVPSETEPVVTRLGRLVLQAAELPLGAPLAGPDRHLCEALERARSGSLEPSSRGAQSRGLLSLALALEVSGDLVGAADVLDRLDTEGVSKDSLIALLGRARLKWLAGQGEHAAQFVSQAVRAAGNQPEMLLEAGLLLLQMGRTEAKEVLHRALVDSQEGQPSIKARARLGLVGAGAVGPETVGDDLQVLMQARHLELFLHSGSWLLPTLLNLPGEVAQAQRTKALKRLVRDLPTVLERAFRAGLPEAATLTALRFIASSGKTGHEGSLKWLVGHGATEAIRGLASEVQDGSEQTQMPPVVRLYLLGPFEVWIGDRRLTRKDWASQKGRYLLARVAAELGRPVPQDTLLDEFFSDLGDTAARNLYQTLSVIRRALQPPNWKEKLKHLDRSPSGIQLTNSLPVWVDLREMLAAKAEAEKLEAAGDLVGAVEHLQEVQRLNRGPFMDGCYMDWALTQRRHYQTQMLELLLRLAHHRSAQGQHGEVVEAADGALAIDNCCQPAYLAKMEALIGLGRPEQAIREFKKCEKTLREELEVETSTELLRAFQKAKLCL